MTTAEFAHAEGFREGFRAASTSDAAKRLDERRRLEDAIAAVDAAPNTLVRAVLTSGEPCDAIAKAIADTYDECAAFVRANPGTDFAAAFAHRARFERTTKR